MHIANYPLCEIFKREDLQNLEKRIVKAHDGYSVAMSGEQRLSDTGEIINPPPPSLKACVFSVLILHTSSSLKINVDIVKTIIQKASKYTL